MKNINFSFWIIVSIISALFFGTAVEIATDGAMNAVHVAFAVLGLSALAYVGMKKQPILFMACGLVGSHQLVTCATKPLAGTEITIWIGNRSEVVGVGLASGNNYIVESITMASGKKFYKFQGFKQSNDFETSMARLKYYNAWTHGGSFLIFDNSGATVKQITDEIAPGNMVIIVENKAKGVAGNAAFEMSGLGVGLVAQEIKRKANDADTQGAWSVKVGTDEGEYEANPPLKVFVTDYAASLAVITGVTAP